MNCAVDVLLTVVVNDVANGVPNSGRWEVGQKSGWGGWGDLGCGSDLCVLHSATAALFEDETGQPGDAFEWSKGWVMCESVE